MRRERASPVIVKGDPIGPGTPATAPRTMSSRSSNLSRKEKALPVGRCAQVSCTLAVRVSAPPGASAVNQLSAPPTARPSPIWRSAASGDAVAVLAVAGAIFGAAGDAPAAGAIGRARGHRGEILGQRRAVADEAAARHRMERIEHPRGIDPAERPVAVER